LLSQGFSCNLPPSDTLICSETIALFVYFAELLSSLTVPVFGYVAGFLQVVSGFRLLYFVCFVHEAGVKQGLIL